MFRMNGIPTIARGEGVGIQSPFEFVKARGSRRTKGLETEHTIEYVTEQGSSINVEDRPFSKFKSITEDVDV